ncbi:MAG: protein kinase, partial [Candidatus Obscuribacterales bacterium]|nr:protein kinase [Candidatus Obscuribacterales bacterium]
MDKNQELPEVIENEEDTSDFEFLNSPVVPELPPDRQVGISSRPAIYRRRSLMGQTVAGRYVVIDLLGEGVITEVYSAQDNDTGKIVVLKVLIDEAPAAQANFRKSAENCRKLEHENIAGILDICQSEDDKTIVIGEFLRAANLRDLQDTVGVFDEQDIYSVLKDICLALDYAHNSGCIHGG